MLLVEARTEIWGIPRDGLSWIISWRRRRPAAEQANGFRRRQILQCRMEWNGEVKWS